jgi:hypothetical protein
MMPKPRKPIVAGGYVEAGKVVWDNPRLVTAALKSWTGRVTVTIAPEVQQRSVRANAYYHGVVLALIAEETGHTADELHEHFKQRFLPVTAVDPLTGEERTYGKSTRTLTVQEFSDYLENVMFFAAEKLGITFPPPRPHEDYRAPAA